MLKRFRAHVSYANVMVTILAFVVLGGGTAYAARAVIDGRDLKSGSVTSPKVANGSLGIVDLSRSARSALAGNDGAPGTRGANGAAGPKGDKGDTGPQGATGVAGAATAGARFARACNVPAPLVAGAGRVLIDLDAGCAGETGPGYGRLTLTERSIVLIDVTITAQNSSHTNNAMLVCQSGGDSTTLHMHTLPVSIEDLQAGNEMSMSTFSMSDQLVLDPGVHNVEVRCSVWNGTAGFYDTNLRVVALPIA